MLFLLTLIISTHSSFAGPPGQPTPDIAPIILIDEGQIANENGAQDDSVALNAEISNLQSQIAQAEKELAAE